MERFKFRIIKKKEQYPVLLTLSTPPPPPVNNPHAALVLPFEIPGASSRSSTQCICTTTNICVLLFPCIYVYVSTHIYKHRMSN
jgi:hypothetical protein